MATVLHQSLEPELLQEFGVVRQVLRILSKLKVIICTNYFTANLSHILSIYCFLNHFFDIYHISL